MRRKGKERGGRFDRKRNKETRDRKAKEWERLEDRGKGDRI